MRRFVDRLHALPVRVATKFAVTFTAEALIALALVVIALALHERRAVTRAAVSDLQAQGNALAPLIGDVLVRDGEPRAVEMLRAANAANANVALTLVRSPVSAPSEPDHAVVVVAIEATGIPPHSLVLETAVPPMGSALEEALKVFLFAAIPLGLFAMLSAYGLGEWLIGAPLRRVAEHTQRIGEGDLEHSLEVRGSTEIAALKRAINTMLDDLRSARVKARDEEARRIAAVNGLRHADRLRTVGTLAAGIAHELGTPLNVILVESRIVERASTNTARVEEGSRLIRAQAGRMVTIIRQLLDFARRKTPARTPEDAVEVVSRSAVLVRSLARVRSCTIEVECAEGAIPFHVDEPAIQQVLTNLFVNAFDAMPRGGRVLVRVQRVWRRGPRQESERSWVCVEVEDEGTGMDDATRSRVFEPFFTTKDVGSGTGLGLSVALGIAEDHDGFMEVRAATPEGTVFALYLPAPEPFSEVGSCEPTTAPPQGGRLPAQA